MKKKISVLIKKKIKKFNKTINVTADKSLSLRALMLASQCIGVSKIKNLLESEDVIDCLKALKKLGVSHVLKGGYIHARSNGKLKGSKIRFKEVTLFEAENLYKLYNMETQNIINQTR